MEAQIIIYNTWLTPKMLTIGINYAIEVFEDSHYEGVLTGISNNTLYFKIHTIGVAGFYLKDIKGIKEI